MVAGALLDLQNVKFLRIGRGVENVGGQVATAIKKAASIGQPLIQWQRQVGAL
jgi:hypothetical protein